MSDRFYFSTDDHPLSSESFNFSALQLACAGQCCKKLSDRSTVEYQELTVEPATKTLYQTISRAVQEQPPKALIVFGIESVVVLMTCYGGY